MTIVYGSSRRLNENRETDSGTLTTAYVPRSRIARLHRPRTVARIRTRGIGTRSRTGPAPDPDPSHTHERPPMTDPRTHAEPIRLTTDGLDHYASRGIALTRDAASTVLAALRRDAYDLRTRPVSANLA